MSTTLTEAPLLDIAAVCIQSRWRLVVRGELDIASGCDLVDAATVLADASVVRADLDLSGIDFIDRAGWRAVQEATCRLREQGASSQVIAASPAVERMAAFARPVPPADDATLRPAA